MRRLAVALAACLALAACGTNTTTKPHLWVTHPLKQCVSSDCGPWSTTLNFQIPTYPGQTGYWLFLNGVQVGTASSSPFTFYGTDCGETDTLGVEAHNGSGGHGPMYTASHTAPACPVLPSGFTFDDEFNGTSIDQTQWSMLDVPGENDQSEPECYFPSQETETGGSMTLTAAFDSTAVACDNNTGGNATTHYPSGAINMHWDNFTYGTVEIRAEMQNAGGAWPALWMLGYKCQDPTTGAYLSNGGIYPTACNTPFSTGTEENDIADVFSNGTAHQTLHTPAAGPPFNNAVDCATPEPSQTAFHTYDMVWSPGTITWSIDGTQVCSYSGADVPSTPEFVIFNMAVGSIGGGTITNSALPQHSFVDYVHVTSSGAAVNTSLPTISGTATHGNVLTVSNGSWTNSPTSYTYQWMRDRTTLISGATSSSYTAQVADEGHTLNCVVIAHNTNGAMAQSSGNTATVN